MRDKAERHFSRRGAENFLRTPKAFGVRSRLPDYHRLVNEPLVVFSSFNAPLLSVPQQNHVVTGFSLRWVRFSRTLKGAATAQNQVISGALPSPGHRVRQRCPASPPVGRGDPDGRSANRKPNAPPTKSPLPLGERVRVRGTANSTASFRIKDGVTRIINSEATVPTPPLKTSEQNSSVPLRTLRETL